MKILFLLSTVVFFVCCSKNSDNPEPYTLNGKWKMTARYSGNGGGQGQWQTPSEPTYYKFTEDSLIVYMGDITLKSAMQKLSDSTFTEKSSPLINTYKIAGDKLTIKNPCDEGCEWRFIRVFF